MKKLISFALAAALMAFAVPALAAETAVATTQNVEVDGKSVEFETYALLDEHGYQTNYAKLRDVAFVLNGTDAQFSVAWSAREGISVTTGTAYTADGTEMDTPYEGDRACQRLSETTEVNGEAQHIAAIRLFDDNGDGYTYYKLRDLGQYLGFQVDWSPERGVYVETDRLYGGARRSDVRALEGTWSGEVDLSESFVKALERTPELKGYFHLGRAAVGVELVSGPTGRYTATLDDAGFDAAAERVRADFVDGMVAYATAQFKTVNMTLEQALQKTGQTREGFEAQFAATFDSGIGSVKAQLLDALPRDRAWTADEAAAANTGRNTLKLALGDGTEVTFTRK